MGLQNYPASLYRKMFSVSIIHKHLNHHVKQTSQKAYLFLLLGLIHKKKIVILTTGICETKQHIIW